MSTKTAYHCDGCGCETDIGTAHVYSGGLHNQATVAAGNEHHWHSCSAACAAKYLRALADAIEAHEQKRIASQGAR